jgi:uncharacterized DUF497 family protein
MQFRPLVYVWHIRDMIDFSLLAGFQWDAGNDRKSIDKHRVSRVEAEQVFFNEPLLVAPDERHSPREEMFQALGRTDDARVLLVAFTRRDNGRLLRVISARDANRREKARYGQEA